MYRCMHFNYVISHRYEVGGFFSGVQDFEDAVKIQKQRQAQRAFARMSVAYDHYLKAGDLYTKYFPDSNPTIYERISDGSYIAPGIEAPGLNDKVLVLNGADKGREGEMLFYLYSSLLLSLTCVL